MAMNGPLLAMPAVLDAGSLFPRSRSSSDIPDLANNSIYTTPQTSSPNSDEQLPRAASFTSLPTLAAPTYNEKSLYRVGSAEPSPTFTRDKGILEDAVVNVDGEIQNKSPPAKEERPKLEKMGRRKSLVARPKSWYQQLKGSPEKEKVQSPTVARTPPPKEVIPPVPPIPKYSQEKDKSKTQSFATFARKSWISTSRSPSPRRASEQVIEAGSTPKNTVNVKVEAKESPRKSSIAVPTLEVPSPAKLPEPKLSESPPKPSRRASTLQKIRARPQSVLLSFTGLTTTNSSTSSLPRSSMDNRSTPRTSTDKVPPIPTAEKLQSLMPEAPRRRDELWSAFRSLENDFSKFQSKTWSLKTNVVRASLLPFLRAHTQHPSNKTLRPEDLDRRITILNKWWCGLLEVLDGRQNQTVSGVDRPVLLEAAVAIMTRPEWRMSSADLVNLTPSSSPERPSTMTKKSADSLRSSASEFLAESVYHHIRILFTQNLLSQMKFVVEKMSLRHAPASLVTFCGKAIAYAFFFVPDVADMLVRIWKLKAMPIQRMADELGLPRRPNKGVVDDIITSFPPHIQSLGWTSVKSIGLALRQRPPLAPALRNVNWHGPWVARWCGRDSDMFFVFVKHYHILTEEFMPLGLTLAEKARSPAFVLVQTQVLSVLDATIHRQPVATEPPPLTFDDVLAGADASAAALPLPSSNSARQMAENRLIMLLRDFISERPSEYEAARLTFADAFGKVMQATARRTSIFHHNACFVLCDFMEEALVLYVRFHHAHALVSDFIDWHFWLDVCKAMLESQNTMSEIRLLTFLYSTWGAVTNNERRKEVMCMEWLLTEEMFDKFFNHWCPMVRAYYMRLLCWRVCREYGEATDLDTKIYCTVLIRLKANWGKFMFLKQAAEKSHALPPLSAPCHPAPGRRLVIMRNDNQATAASLLVGFDGIMGPTAKSKAKAPPTASKRLSALVTLSKLDTDDDGNPKLASDSPTTPSKKRWTFGRKTSSSPAPNGNGNGNSGSPPSTQGPAPTKNLDDARRETAMARTRPSIHPHGSSSDSSPGNSAASTYRPLSFKFSLEWSQHFERNESSASKFQRLGWRLIPPRLPAPAQSWIGTKMPGISREVGPKDPVEEGPDAVTRSKYAGRALAEWAHIVGECNGFVDRRRAEGVPGLKGVEVPALGVEGFRKFG